MKKITFNVVINLFLLSAVINTYTLSRILSRSRQVPRLGTMGERRSYPTPIKTNPQIRTMSTQPPKKPWIHFEVTPPAEAIKIVNNIKNNRMPEIKDIDILKSIHNQWNASGFIISKVLSSYLNETLANGNSLLFNTLGIAVGSKNTISDNDVRIIKDLYDLGARLNEKESADFQSQGKKFIIDLANQLRTNYFNIPLEELRLQACLIDIMYYVGLKESVQEIDLGKIKKFAQIPSLSRELATKTLHQLFTLSKADRNKLFTQEKSFQDWWKGEESVSQWNIFGIKVTKSVTSDGLLDVAQFVKNIPHQKNESDHQSYNNQKQSNQEQTSSGLYSAKIELLRKALPGVKYIPSASAREIKDSYIKYIKEHHTDITGISSENLMRINNLYDNAKKELDTVIKIERSRQSGE